MALAPTQRKVIDGYLYSDQAARPVLPSITGAYPADPTRPGVDNITADVDTLLAYHAPADYICRGVGDELAPSLSGGGCYVAAGAAVIGGEIIVNEGSTQHSTWSNGNGVYYLILDKTVAGYPRLQAIYSTNWISLADVAPCVLLAKVTIAGGAITEVADLRAASFALRRADVAAELAVICDRLGGPGILSGGADAIGDFSAGKYPAFAALVRRADGTYAGIKSTVALSISVGGAAGTRDLYARVAPDALVGPQTPGQLGWHGCTLETQAGGSTAPTDGLLLGSGAWSGTAYTTFAAASGVFLQGWAIGAGSPEDVTAIFNNGHATPAAVKLLHSSGELQARDAGGTYEGIARRAGSPTANNVAKVDAQGDPADGGFALSDVARLSQAQTFAAQQTLTLSPILSALTASEILGTDASKKPVSGGFALADVARLSPAQTVAGQRTYTLAPILTPLTAGNFLKAGASKEIVNATMATAKVLGRATAATGAVEELDCVAAGRTILASSVAATAYQASSTVVGWADLAGSNVIRYERIGNKVTVHYQLRGTSDGATGTGASFTVPYAAAGIPFFGQIFYVKDNNVDQTSPGIAIISAGASVVTLYKTLAFGGWTAANQKAAYGVIEYITS